MKTIAFIQARMGSTRLPGKVLMDIGGKPAILQVYDRVKRSTKIADVWIITTLQESDDPLVDLCKEKNIRVFRGSENDVLERYYEAAKQAGAEGVIRITGDCPLMDYEVIDTLLETFETGEYGYVSNVHPPTFPDGIDVEIFTFAALEKAWKEATLTSEREHVTPYIWKHPEIFKMKNILCEEDLSSYRWTLDTPEDLDFLRLVIEECNKQNEYCNYKKVREIVDAHPEWKTLNEKFERNEGYTKSVGED